MPQSDSRKGRQADPEKPAAALTSSVAASVPGAHAPNAPAPFATSTPTPPASEAPGGATLSSIAVCTMCDRRAEDPVAASCIRADCPMRQRSAA